MENILSYIKQLAPVYERRDLLAALNQIQEEHSTTVTPILDQVTELLVSRELKTPIAAAYAKTLSRTVNFGRRNPLELLVGSLEQLQKNYPFLEKEVRRLFSIQITTASITYDRVSLLRYIESAAFYLRYARKLLLNILAEEAALKGGTPPTWSKEDKRWLIDNMPVFAGLYEAIDKPESQLKSVMSQASSAEVDEETVGVAAQTLGIKGTDPLKLGLWSPQRNPLLSAGKWMAELQVKRNKAAREELYALQQRLQELREIENEGRVKPNLQKFIQVTEDRIKKLDFQVSRFEEENAYD